MGIQKQLLTGSICVALMLYSINDKAVNESKKIDGILYCNVVAVGGETTGIEVETPEGVIYDLDLTHQSDLNSPDLNSKVQTWDHRPVTVIGQAYIKFGKERIRRIIQVEDIFLKTDKR